MIEPLFEPVVMLGIHVSLVAIVIRLVTRWTRLGHQTVLAIVGTIGILLFVICIGIPFFFQGYSDVSALRPGTALGWTKNPAIGVFAYVYSGKWTGFAWLSTSIVCTGLGRISRRTSVDVMAKSALVLLACVMLVWLDVFAQTINPVLE